MNQAIGAMLIGILFMLVACIFAMLVLVTYEFYQEIRWEKSRWRKNSARGDEQ